MASLIFVGAYLSYDKIKRKKAEKKEFKKKKNEERYENLKKEYEVEQKTRRMRRSETGIEGAGNGAGGMTIGRGPTPARQSSFISAPWDEDPFQETPITTTSTTRGLNVDTSPISASPTATTTSSFSCSHIPYLSPQSSPSPPISRHISTSHASQLGVSWTPDTTIATTTTAPDQTTKKATSDDIADDDDDDEYNDPSSWVNQVLKERGGGNSTSTSTSGITRGWSDGPVGERSLI